MSTSPGSRRCRRAPWKKPGRSFASAPNIAWYVSYILIFLAEGSPDLTWNRLPRPCPTSSHRGVTGKQCADF
jgi:hypothetical protein